MILKYDKQRSLCDEIIQRQQKLIEGQSSFTIRVVTKRCRLSWLTNNALVYEPKCGGGGFGASADEYSCAHGAQINFGDLTPYLTYA